MEILNTEDIHCEIIKSNKLSYCSVQSNALYFNYALCFPIYFSNISFFVFFALLLCSFCWVSKGVWPRLHLIYKKRALPQWWEGSIYSKKDCYCLFIFCRCTLCIKSSFQKEESGDTTDNFTSRLLLSTQPPRRRGVLDITVYQTYKELAKRQFITSSHSFSSSTTDSY